ncbi:hypothetical protein F2Q68_00032322 [Brassica cretica]|uniref:Uncharacterized protein n=2 Tax=Brassica cretica TaxID=69181 RepID=A0ABQ7BK21_BRACR|nr:hypothetical protein F2Q68_00032322 [Brassica cretica]KAF3532668.1 hypothetical protein DY000_02042411 [Brassica cretica]
MWPAKKKNARGAGGEHKGSESSISRKKREIAARGRRIALTLLIVLVLVTTGIDAISSTMALFFFFVCGEIGAQEGGESESTVMTTTGF